VSTFSQRARTNWRPKVRFAPPIPKFQFSTASNASRLNLRTSQSVPTEILQLQESVIPPVFRVAVRERVRDLPQMLDTRDRSKITLDCALYRHPVHQTQLFYFR
jgi:hypothetical protein